MWGDMHLRSKILAAIALGALISGCSGGGNTFTPASGSPGGPTTQSIPRSAVGSDGRVMTFFYTKQVEQSGRVGDSASGPQTKATTSNLTYHNGPIQTNPKIYVVYWGSAWNTTSGDPRGVHSYYDKFMAGIGGSSWLNSVTQYTQSDGQHVGNAAGSYNASTQSWVDTTNAVPSLTGSNYQSLFAAEAARAAAHFGDYSTSASYVIAVSHGVAVNGFAGSCTGFFCQFQQLYCAWHSSTSANGSTIAYTNLPYIPDAGTSCGQGSVTSPGYTDGVSIVGGHEQGETETDPQPNTGWLDSSNAENGDKCAWTNLKNSTFSTGTFPTQPLWSNAISGCTQ